MRIGWEDVRLSLQPTTREAIQNMLKTDDPPQHVKAKFLLDQLERGQELITSYSAPVQVVRFGDELLLIALSGEPVIDWAHKLKSQYQKETNCGDQVTSKLQRDSERGRPEYPAVWVAGYCNDVFDYVPTRRIQTEGGYEGGRANLWNWIPTPFTDDIEDRVTAAVERLVNEVNC